MYPKQGSGKGCEEQGSGMGLTLVRKLLEQGYKVAATSRTKADLE
ncbi:hypothetical protein ACP8HI_06210 [Paenibacillus sp. FA6]